MQEKKYNDVKKEIRSVLLTYKDSVTLEEFLKAFRGLLGQRLPSRELGYSTDADFLYSMPDVVDIKSDSHGKVYLTGIADKASQHIQKLVSRQRKSKSSNNKSTIRQPFHKLPYGSAKEFKSFLPGELRVEILQLMTEYECGITFPAFSIAYYKKFKKYLPLPEGFNTLENLVKLIPELEVRVEEENVKAICHKKVLTDTKNERENYKKDVFSSKQANGDYKNVMLEKNAFTIDKSGVQQEILKVFQMIMRKCPDGIQNIHFPMLYENVTGKSFDILQLGYNSLADLTDALPHIFKRIPNPEDERYWLIYPAESPVKQSSKAENATPNSSKKQISHPLRDGIPADVSSPILQYILPTMPNYVNLNEYIPIFVSAIKTPSLFWFQLQTDEAVKKFAELENEMGMFYNYASDSYKMNNADIAIGATCVIQCPDDYLWYRGVIKSIPSTNLVNVLFVDYGSRENVPRSKVYYVWSKFHEFPACAFKAQLADLKPPKNASSWSIQAQKRFIQLCDSATLMACVKLVDKDIYSAYLCNTNGDTDIHLNDTLITEGYAECCHETQSHVKIPSSETETTPNGKNISINYESDSSPRSNKGALQLHNHAVIDNSNILSAKRRLSFSLEEQDSVLKPNSAHFSTDQGCKRYVKLQDSIVKLNAHFNTNQGCKRYVKLIELCEDGKIHIINLECKLFMSCEELCKLLWSEKKANFLIERLMYKEVDIPFLKVEKEDHSELFKQCIWYKIPGFQDLHSSNSSLILYPLEEAFNILNIFGHPSVCLRLVIQNEIKIFDPSDAVWKEFSYGESSDLNNIEKDIQEKLNKLCLYDLKAKSEALKVKRLKLLIPNTDSSTEELKRVENLQNAVLRRIELIESICNQYSSCS